jgi:hypothetical protein
MEDWFSILAVMMIGILIISLVAIVEYNKEQQPHITYIGDPTCMDKLNQCWNQCEGNVVMNQPPVFVYISGEVN